MARKFEKFEVVPPLAGVESTSVVGQKRRFDPLPATSGLPRGTGIARPAQLVRFVPIGDSGPSFDDLVGGGEQRWRQSFQPGKDQAVHGAERLPVGRMPPQYVNLMPEDQDLGCQRSR